MKIIQPNVKFIQMPTDKASLLKHIERCGRVCYKSEDKTTEGSAEQFIAGIIKRGHEAVLEHGAIILLIDIDDWSTMQERINDLESGGDFQSFLRFTDDWGRPLVSGNIRAWRDFMRVHQEQYGHTFGCLRYMIEKYPELFPEFQKGVRFLYIVNDYTPGELYAEDLITENEKLHHQYQTLLFTCDRGVSHELVRHRPSSFCQESTRYCNYGKDGFGNEITVIEPCFFTKYTPKYDAWMQAMLRCESLYLHLLNLGATPQEARSVLPSSLKTELMMTANLSEWRHVTKLRCAPAAHPQARQVMKIGLGMLESHITDTFDDLWEDYGNE